jgi:hypothetical protein
MLMLLFPPNFKISLDHRFSFQVAKLPEEAMIVPQPSEII